MSNDIKYFTSTSFRRGYCIDITEEGDFDTSETITYAQSYYSIVLLHENRNEYYINLKKIPTTDNFLVIRPEDVVSYKGNSKIVFLELCLDDTFFDLLSEKEEFKTAYSFLFNSWKSNSWRIDDTLFDILEEKLLSIKTILETGKGVKDKYMVLALFIECITLLDKNIGGGNKSDEDTGNVRTQTVTNRFYALVDKHFKKESNVTFYADKLCMTTSSLCRTIKTATGKTTKQIITLRKTHEAQRLLTYSDKDICEIATLLGFPDAKEFCRAFKKQTGVLPAEYRKTYKK